MRHGERALHRSTARTTLVGAYALAMLAASGVYADRSDCRGPGFEHSGRRPLRPRVPRQRSGGRGCRSSPSPGHDTMAGPGDRCRPIAGHPAGEASGAGPALGRGIRLAEGGSEAQCPAAIRHDHRWCGRSLHPRPLASSERVAPDHDPRLARLGLRAAQDRRPADRSHGLRWTRGRRLRSRHALDSRLRLLRQAEGPRMESRSHRTSVGRADEAPRLHPLRRPGRRLGLPRLQRDGAPGARGFARHPHQLAGDRPARGGRGAGRRRARAGGTLRQGTGDVRRAQRGRQERRQVLRGDDGDPAADDRLRLDGLPGRPRGVDARASRLLAVDVQQQRSREVARTRCSTR